MIKIIIKLLFDKVGPNMFSMSYKAFAIIYIHIDKIDYVSNVDYSRFACL